MRPWELTIISKYIQGFHPLHHFAYLIFLLAGFLNVTHAYWEPCQTHWLLFLGPNWQGTKFQHHQESKMGEKGDQHWYCIWNYLAEIRLLRCALLKQHILLWDKQNAFPFLLSSSMISGKRQCVAPVYGPKVWDRTVLQFLSISQLDVKATCPGPKICWGWPWKFRNFSAAVWRLRAASAATITGMAFVAPSKPKKRKAHFYLSSNEIDFLAHSWTHFRGHHHFSTSNAAEASAQIPLPSGQLLKHEFISVCFSCTFQKNRSPLVSGLNRRKADRVDINAFWHICLREVLPATSI